MHWNRYTVPEMDHSTVAIDNSPVFGHMTGTFRDPNDRGHPLALHNEFLFWQRFEWYRWCRGPSVDRSCHGP
jgi:hypothetical protein